jgi:2-dehydropantoate 2-reductase
MEEAAMRLAVVGAGGVGGLLAGLAARAGIEVALLARGAALEAIRSDGLHVTTGEEQFTVRPAAVADDPAALGPCDAVLVAVKSWQVAELAPRLAPLVAPGGVVVPLQNGVEAGARLAAGLPGVRVSDGVTYVFAWSEGPGRIRHAGTPLKIAMGERPGAPLGGALAPLAATLASAGVKAVVSDAIEVLAWEKLLFVAPFGAVGAVSRAPAGAIRDSPETRKLFGDLVAEGAAVARARGVALSADVGERTLAWLDRVAWDATVSMQRDLAAGRPSELLDQTGVVSRFGADVGVPVPLHDTLLASLLPLERSARGETPRFVLT